MNFPIDIQNYQLLIGTHNLYKPRVLNLETITNADCRSDCFDLLISEVLQDQHMGILGMSAGNPTPGVIAQRKNKCRLKILCNTDLLLVCITNN